MTVKDIVYEWLRERGYVGLCKKEFSSCDCSCELDDLFPCADNFNPACGIDCSPWMGETGEENDGEDEENQSNRDCEG